MKGEARDLQQKLAEPGKQEKPRTPISSPVEAKSWTQPFKSELTEEDSTLV